MTPEEHQAIMQKAERGELLVGIDRVVARKFFTRVPHHSIEEAIGECIYFERFLVQAAFILAPLAILASMILAVFLYGWWGLGITALVPIYWFFYFSQSCLAGRGLIGIGLVLASSFLLLFVGQIDFGQRIWLVITALAFFLARFLYVGAEVLMRALVYRNSRAFELLLGDGVFLKET